MGLCKNDQNFTSSVSRESGNNLYCRVVNDHAMWYVWYVVQPDVLYDCAGSAGYISVEHRAFQGCLRVIVLECSISNTLLILVCYMVDMQAS
jgi:hypothetical protein